MPCLSKCSILSAGSPIPFLIVEEIHPRGWTIGPARRDSLNVWSSHGTLNNVRKSRNMMAMNVGAISRNRWRPNEKILLL
jgi:hypothetical protein